MQPHPLAIRLDQEGYQGALNLYGDLIDEVVAFGSHLVIRLLHPKTVSNAHLTIALSLRHLVEELDGVSTLLRFSRPEPAKVVMRAAFEAALSLTYMVESDSDRRTLCYRFGHLHRQLDRAESLDPSTDSGRRAREDMSTDTSGFKIEPHDTRKQADELRSKIELAVYAEARAEWDEQKKRLPPWRAPAWHSLFGGPSSLRSLAKHLGMSGQYELLYRDWSGAAHAETLMEKVEVVGGEGRVPAMRDPTDLQTLCSIAASTAIAGYRKTIQALVPREMESFRAWYAHEVAEPYRRVSDSSNPIIRSTSA